VDLLRTLRDAADQHGVSLQSLGDVHTLVDRIRAEALAQCWPVGFAGIVSAWCKTTAESPEAHDDEARDHVREG
jgi:hypothetical protein